MRDTDSVASERRWWPVLGLIARVVVGGVWLVAGWLKLPDPAEGVRAVRAFRLLPESVVPTVGHALPVVEIVVGSLLLVGLVTRASASVSALMQVAFVVGISAAWARGIQIQCGCFGGGGATVADAAQKYPWDIARDVGLAVASAALVVWPTTRLALDSVVFATSELDQMEEMVG